MKYKEISSLYDMNHCAFWFVSSKIKNIPHQFYARDDHLDFVRRVDAKKMENLPDLFDEFYAAFQLMPSFGHNWHALEEYMCNLDDLWPSCEAYLVVVCNSDNLLHTDADQIEWFFKVINDVATWWSKPVEDNPPFDRPPVLFRCVLESSKKWALNMQAKLDHWEIPYKSWSE